MPITRKRSVLQVAAKSLRELRRGWSIARAGGVRAGWVFVREEVVRNSLVRLAPGRARVECNVCGWRGARFLTHCGAGYVNFDAFCPACMSYPRHRGFAYLLEHDLAHSRCSKDCLAQTPLSRQSSSERQSLVRIFGGAQSRSSHAGSHGFERYCTGNERMHVEPLGQDVSSQPAIVQ